MKIGMKIGITVIQLTLLFIVSVLYQYQLHGFALGILFCAIAFPYAVS